MFLNSIKNIILVLIILSSGMANELVFTNEKEGISFVISEDGSVIANIEAEESANLNAASPTKSLQFKYSNSKMMNLDHEKMRLRESLISRGKFILWSDYYDDATEEPLSFRPASESTPRSLLTNEGTFICDFSEGFLNVTKLDEPNYVRTISYQERGCKKPAITTEYSDGFGRAIQTQEKINTSKSLVLGNYYNEHGHLVKSTLTAPVLTLSGYYEMNNNTVIQGQTNEDKLLGKINDFYVGRYPESGRYAFSESEYSDDPLNVVKKTGSPGSEHRLNGGHDRETWTFGVSSYDKSKFVQFSEVSNIATADPHDIDVIKAITLLNENKDDDVDSKYILTVSRDVNNQFSQKISNTRGNVLKIAHFFEGELVASTLEYDDMGNVLRQNPPDDNTAPSTYEYNSFGQIIKSWSPDKGLTTFTYNDDGSLASSTDANERTLFYEYDILERIIKISEASRDHIKMYYDNIENADEDIINLENSSTILNEIKNIRGRLFCEISLSEEGNVVDLFSYNEEGDNIATYRNIPGLAWQKIEYVYGFRGRVEKEIINPTYLSQNPISPIVKIYNYDELGRLIKIKLDNDLDDNPEDDKLYSSLKYDDMKLVSQTFYDGKSDRAVIKKTSNDNIQGWTTILTNTNEITKEILFEEIINYQGYYDGTISKAEYKYNFEDEQRNIELKYYYDENTQLTSVEPTNSSFLQYQEAFGYDKNGRLTFKTKNSESNTSYYKYQTLTEAGYTSSQLTEKGLSGSLKTNRFTGFSDDANFFKYDKNGNVIEDLRKNLVLIRDWRDMPSKMFLRPGGENLDDDVEITMLYDASGNRVLKKIKKTNEHSSIAYSIGGLVFHNENLDILSNEYKLISANVDEGRLNYYDEESSNYENEFVGISYYLTDHLGSTRMMIEDDGSVNSAEFYSAFGGMDKDFRWNPNIELLKLREQYTGKEFDTDGQDLDYDLEGINLTYFGARFLDPEIGIWLSTDPEEQYWNSYSFCGNNPINLVDHDGRMAGAASLVGGGIDISLSGFSLLQNARTAFTFSTQVISVGTAIGATALTVTEIVSIGVIGTVGAAIGVTAWAFHVSSLPSTTDYSIDYNTITADAGAENVTTNVVLSEAGSGSSSSHHLNQGGLTGDPGGMDPNDPEDYDEFKQKNNKGNKIRKKPGKRGQFKGRDALRRENNMARDAAKRAKLSKDQARRLHDEISGQDLDFKEILRIAKDIGNGL